jgi:2-polyprenyl-6-methoxyphenol hydroxylase-like FAD-dependent oxidoreductase
MFTPDVNYGKVESKTGETVVEAPKANGHVEEVVSTEEVKCKYLVGCDGARSWVRK